MSGARQNPRDNVRQSLFPVSLFFVLLLVLLLMSGVHEGLLVLMDVKKVPTVFQVSVPIIYWAVVSIGLTVYTGLRVKKTYETPIKLMAEATARVASGDFSVYVPPQHTPDRLDYLDVMFLDFNKMVEELGSIETLKTDFFSNVSHEIKTPIAVIQNNAELLRSGVGTQEQQREYIETILQATGRLSGLITNMLKLNKLEKQVIKPVPEAFDVSAQLCECALQFEEVWEKKGITFDADIEERVIIEADAGLLELVWTNLLSNAFKFTPAGGSVRITQTRDRERITVTVSDTGCGMSEATRRHIFDKFYQGDTSHATEGNGLGLALVKRIMELSDGTISVKSEPWKGSVFTVTLPAAGNQEE